MILADTSIWIDYFRSGKSDIRPLLDAEQIFMHPLVLGELTCGSIHDREVNLRFLRGLPESRVAMHDEVLHFLERHRLMGRGIGFIDVHLLASAAITDGTSIWTKDLRLRAAATDLELAYRPN